MGALLLDLDGVLYEGERTVPGAAEAVRGFRERGVPHLFLTNTTSRPRSALVSKLAGLGIEVEIRKEWLTIVAPIDRAVELVAQLPHESLEHVDAEPRALLHQPPKRVTIQTEQHALLGGPQRGTRGARFEQRGGRRSQGR